MNIHPAPLALALLSGACAPFPRPEQVRALRPLPTAPAAEIVTGRSEGSLESRRGCLFLTRDGPRGAIRLLVIWPTGSRFDGRAVVPALPGRPAAYLIGDRLAIEGSAPDWAPYLITAYPRLAAWRDRCGERPLFVAAIRRTR